MGLIKNWADVNGTKHQVDPTGHTHSTSESWLSTIVNNITTLINGKASTVHTHTKSQITDFDHTHTKSQITDFPHTHTQSDVIGLVSELNSKASIQSLSFLEEQSNKVTEWSDELSDEHYPSEKLTKEELDTKTNRNFHFVQSGAILDLDGIIYGDSYMLHEMYGHTLNERLTSTLEFPIIYHQNYTGNEFNYAIIRVYKFEDKYLVEIAGLYNQN